MIEHITIPNDRVLSLAEDYQLLRQEGLKYIESLGSDLWTDYNTHDPGITILEALCYAITELAYRTNLPVADLLAGKDGAIGNEQAYYTARDILTCSPVTLNDYRKLMVDIKGVHNAWLYPGGVTSTPGKNAANEVPLFADCKKDELTTEPTDHPLYLSGLYQVLLDLDHDAEFGDLNKGDMEVFNPASGDTDPKFQAGDISFTMELPFVHDARIDFVQAAADEAKIIAVDVQLADGKWVCQVSIDDGSPPFQFFITINIKLAGKTIEVADMQAMFTNKYVSQIFYLYGQKLQKINDILLHVKRVLHQHRNLCEDFVKIETVNAEEVAVCVDIDVRADADMEKIQAEVFYWLEHYFNPSVNFYLLKELLAKGKKVEEIFEGPKLKHGFIDTAELEATQLRSVIYTSDIINLLMDIDGVLAVRNLMLTKYDQDGNAVKGKIGLKWCMHISPVHKPVLSVNRSKIVFFKNNFPFLAGYAEIKDTLQLLRASRQRPKLQGQQDDLPLPKGRIHELDDYYSIQNDLPRTYGVGVAGLPLSASPMRKAQARQLKAYLLFYDQLLAGFFSQLGNAKNLFSLNDIHQTFYTKFLDDIPDIMPVYKESAPNNAWLKDVFVNQDSTAASTNDAWKALVENEETYHSRRNKLLDHLLARFAESFNDYVLMMYNINQSGNLVQAVSSQKLINSKIDLLKEYPALSYGRGTAFNYYPLNDLHEIDEAQLWDTTNVSGLEKRASKLAGIINYTRRFLSCLKNIEVKAKQEKEIQEDETELVKTFYSFSIQNKRGDILLPKEKYENRDDAEQLAGQLVPLLSDKANYMYDVPSKKIEVINADSNVVVVSEQTYTSKSVADKAIRQFVKEFKEACADAEGMVLIEHILLRPRAKQYKLMQVCLDKNCDFCGEEDPYTFRASVYLPYWPGSFNNMHFRNYFANMIRNEAPAHILLKVCWLSNTDLRTLEVVYKRWICSLANFTHDPLNETYAKQFAADNDELVQLLHILHTVYPEATLHDCDESVNTNPVMLGRTILGTIKPEGYE